MKVSAFALRRIAIPMIFLLLILGGNDGRAVAATDGHTITVTTTADEDDTGPECSLREAIDAANTNTVVSGCSAGSPNGTDQINISEGTYLLKSGGFVISSNMILHGFGADVTIIDGDWTSRVFRVASGAVVEVENLTLRKGSALPTGNGGAIDNAGTVTLAKSIVIGNRARSGGSIDNKGVMTVIESRVEDNSSAFRGGGIYNSGTLTVTNSQVYTNTARNPAPAGGGGIYNEGTLVLTNNSRVSGNNAISNGGGLYNSNEGEITLTDSSVILNTADFSGGGIYSEGNLTLIDSVVISNTGDRQGGGIYNQKTLTMTNSMVSANIAGWYGGGIYNSGGRMTVQNSTISSNKAADYDGGGIWNSGVLTMRASSVISNTADQSGGGIVNGGTATVTNTIVHGNTSSGGLGGGGIRNSRTMTLINSTISGNTAHNSSFADGIGNSGTLNAYFVTIYGNGRINLYISDSSSMFMYATIVAQPSRFGTNCLFPGAVTADSAYNRISNHSCVSDGQNGNKTRATILLEPLNYNGGPTLNYLPTPSRENAQWEGELGILDQIPPAHCLVGESPMEEDQRGRPRPRPWSVDAGDSQGDFCDVGAAEYFQETRYVCPDKDSDQYGAGRQAYDCESESIQEVLDKSVDGDTIVIAGMITETVTVTKSVTFRGPSPDEGTPGTHMGIVQGLEPGPTFTIGEDSPCPDPVTIKDLNIRHTNPGDGRGIRNNCTLGLDGVTLFGTETGVENRGALTLVNSTLTQISGTAIDNAADASLSVTHGTIDGLIANAGSTEIRGSLIADCSGAPLTNTGHSLLYADNDSSCTSSSSPFTPTTAADLDLGPLRDNGGPTLTLDILSPSSHAVNKGADSCADLNADQRGKARPLDENGEPGGQCDIGAVEYGTQTLTVCRNCNRDPASLRYSDLQEALNRAMAGDTLAVEAGTYTGNFIVYKDGIIRHAGLDISNRSPEQAVDVRAILQASVDPVLTQARALGETRGSDLSGTVLTVHGYAITASGLQPAVDLADSSLMKPGATLQDLTVRHGFSRQGGGIANHGDLTLIRTTLHDNAAINASVMEGSDGSGEGGAIYSTGLLHLERSTLSGNRSEYRGGAVYSRGSHSSLHITASTLVDNVAGPLPDIWTVGVRDDGFDIDTLGEEELNSARGIAAGDWIVFESRAGSTQRTIRVTPRNFCNTDTVEVPLTGGGQSPPLVCPEGTITLDDGNQHIETVVWSPLSFDPEAHTVYRQQAGAAIIEHSLILTALGVGANCANDIGGIASGGYIYAQDDSCGVSLTSDVNLREEYPDRAQWDIVGPLQDNNQIDFGVDQVSGYVYTHALLPGSPAVDQIPVETCTGISETLLKLTPPFADGMSLSVEAGGILNWQLAGSAAGSHTVALRDGEATVRLIVVPADGSQTPTQLFKTTAYRVYNDAGELKGGGTITVSGTITVTAPTLPTDQRGVSLPLRGVRPQASDQTYYRCDIGAYEFQPWVVGEPLPRPPSAIGQNPPNWEIQGQGNGQDYHLWSFAASQDLVMRPSLDTESSDTDLPDSITVVWTTDPNPGAIPDLRQTGLAIWPEQPQLHIAGAPVNFSHGDIGDDFLIAGAEAFADRTPLNEVEPLNGSVFNRNLVEDGATYSVLRFANANGSNPTMQGRVVQTVEPETPGVWDADPETQCVIGKELDYRFTAANGTDGGHADPESRPGFILAGNAFDGVESAGEQLVLQNTVDGLIPPAHIRRDRQGPILPVLETFPNPRPTAGDGRDLDVAWYRPDSRNVAWPVKAAGYKCAWPTDPDQIVIASELGSEIGGQPILDAQVYGDPTVYHQSVQTQPGYSPNWEHALLAPSNLGNPAPALYALRTDLKDRISGGDFQSYALLKYRDLTQDGRVQMAVYAVKLNQDAEALSPPPDVQAGSGTVTVSGGRVTVPVVVDTRGKALHTITARVAYSPTQVTPVECTPNRNDFVEAPHGLQLFSDSPMRPGWPVHFEARLQAGTDVQYEWFFDFENKPDEMRIAGSQVSTVYETAATYQVRVRAVTGSFFPVERTIEVTIADNAVPTALPQDSTDGCQIANYLFNVDMDIRTNLNGGSLPGTLREQFTAMGISLLDSPTVTNTGTSSGPWLIKNDSQIYTLIQRGDRIHAYESDRTASTEDTLVFDMQARNKHGEIGALTLADITFEKAAGDTAESTLTAALSGDALGPDYSRLRYDITAGNPVYAPTPLRGLLDVQICEGTQVFDAPNANPYWEDFKGQVWARSAGEMEVLYFYPLQPGFYLDNSHTQALGLPDTEAERVGQCVPWMDKLEEADTRLAGDSRVLPVAYTASWPVLAPVLTVGETVFERSKNGISGVAEQLAVTRIYDDKAPGAWNDVAKTVDIAGLAGVDALAQLIDPVGEVRVELPVTVDGNPSLPSVISSQRLLFGGGNALVANTDDPDTALPFSLRSRITFEDTPQDIDGDGTAHGVLVFRGYYDGTSPAYIKGDPLLLLNVMFLSDKDRLLALCPIGEENCAKYRTAIEELYWKTLNPRQLDLCRNANGELFPGDSENVKNHGASSDTVSSQACAETYHRDGEPDKAFLIAVQDANNDGIPEPYEGLGKGKAVTAGNSAGTGYVTLAYNNDDSLGGLPVSLQVVQVGCTQNQDGEDSTYRGNLLAIESDNLFDEKLTLRHTGDFGGKPDGYDFEWYYAPVDDTGVSPSTQPPAYPWRKWNGAGAGTPEITIEGANVTTLSDNWFVMRYKGYDACGNSVRYSAYAGDPSAKPSELRAQLAQGWIKRVTNALNPFDARVDDFVSSPTNVTVDMIAQAGPRYEGPVAMSNDPETLNNMGLIEAYQTVLDRGRALSIDSNINDQGANAALLNVTTRIADLYMLLANDAYMDSLDPTVGLGTNSVLGIQAPTLYSFMNQFNAAQFGLIDEELALLRGRDETLGGVAVAPTYNRLTWNFTNGLGETAYVQNYNMKDWNEDGFVDEADAVLRYPQGHGDAWGHYLTALSKYYQLLRHPQYTWSPRAEPISVAGTPVVVDYYDERRFAVDAAAKAQMGAEIVDLTYRKQWADPDSQAYIDTHVDASDNTSRAWGVADWAVRSGQGAFFDWAVANAILPVAEERFQDVRKIDRATVLEVGQIAEQVAAIQEQLDQADQDVNPLGLNGNALLFDLDPSRTQTGSGGLTHYEQVYERALAQLGNTVTLFDYANAMKVAQRESQNQQRSFTQQIVDQDRALVNDLIELFGYPYDADMGVNGTYPEGYEGPDIYNYDLWDRIELTDAQKRCSQQDIQNHSSDTSSCPAETTTFTVEYSPLVCLGNYVEYIKTGSSELDASNLCPNVDLGSTAEAGNVISITYTVAVGLDAGRGRFKPASWDEASARKAPGDIQNAIQALNQARLEYEMAITAYENHVGSLDGQQKAIQDRAAVLSKKGELTNAARWTLLAIDGVIAGMNAAIRTTGKNEQLVQSLGDAAAECPPGMVGLAVDATSPVRCAFKFAAQVGKFSLSMVELAIGVASDALGYSKDVIQAGVDTALFDLEADYELRQMGREMAGLLADEKELRLALFLAKDKVNDAQGAYDQTLQRGFRKLQELIRLRQRWAGQITEQRYGDMAFRTAQIDALTKYRHQFDLTQQYTWLTAAAYDYETNLATDDADAAEQFLRQIVGVRSLGQVSRAVEGWLPVANSGGLADPLARMHDNFAVLKGQMGFNNPQDEENRFSLRRQLFRLRQESDTAWRQGLLRYYTTDVYADDDVARLAKRPLGADGPQPGLVIPFDSTITSGLNFFGRPMGRGDGAFDASQFSTKIASVGVWFEGYDPEWLSSTPRVYLIPAGQDVIRPRGSEGVLRYWNITEQLLPLPYAIGQADLANPSWIPRIDGLTDQMYKTKPYTRFRAYPYSPDFDPGELQTDTRLIGRSVWNTRWLLVIPGTDLLHDPQQGIEDFIASVDDIYLYFQTYAYAGTRARQAEAQLIPSSAGLLGPQMAAPVSRLSTALTDTLPLPDALLYGPASMEAGTVQALWSNGEATAQLAPITGTPYHYVLNVPMGQNPDGSVGLAGTAGSVDQRLLFTLNGSPAFFTDGTGLTKDSLTVNQNSVGRPQLLALDTRGPDSYPLGDVNASGRRNSADAMLMLKHDIGLVLGVTTFPPGPNTVYLPLCDVMGDGGCDSVDALRTLQCDVGLTEYDCPTDNLAPADLAAATVRGPESAAPVTLRLEVKPGDDPGQITLRLLAIAQPDPFGALTLGLTYDSERLAMAGCTENPQNQVELVLCNSAFTTDTVRLGAVQVQTMADEVLPAEVSFRWLDQSSADLAPLFSLTALVYDGAGDEMSWQADLSGLEAPKILNRRLYFPLLRWGKAALEASSEVTGQNSSQLASDTPGVESALSEADPEAGSEVESLAQPSGSEAPSSEGPSRIRIYMPILGTHRSEWDAGDTP